MRIMKLANNKISKITCLLFLSRVLLAENHKTTQAMYKNIWEMVEVFGLQNNVKHWVLHYESKANLDWKQAWHTIAGLKRNLGWFSAHEISNSNVSFGTGDSNSIVTINLYVARDLNPLYRMLNQENSQMLSKSYRMEINDNIASSFWMVYFPAATIEDEISERLEKFPLRYDSMVFTFKAKTNVEIDINEIYRLPQRENTIVKNYGTWRKCCGFEIVNSKIWSRRRDLEGYHFKAAAIPVFPFYSFIEDNCQSKDCLKGLFADVWIELSRAMNFTYTIQKAEAWGSLENGSWNGLVRMLYENEIDIAPQEFTVFTTRASAIDFLPTIYQTRELLFLRNPEKFWSFYAYIKPLKIDAWIGVLLFAIVIPVLIAIVIHYENYHNRSVFKLSDCYQFMLKTLIMQGSWMLPRNNASRIALGAALFGGITIYYLWEAMLISYLAVKRTELPLRTYEDLLQRSDYKLVVPQGSYYLDIFRYSKDPFKARIWKEKIEPNIESYPQRFEELIPLMLNDPFVVVHFEETFTYEKAYLDCRIIDTGSTIRRSHLAWALPKNSPFYGVFAYHIKRLKETGTFDRYSLSYKRQPQVCQDNSGLPISMQQCFTLFLILVFGILSSLTWLGVEIITPSERMNSVRNAMNENFEIFLSKLAGKGNEVIDREEHHESHNMQQRKEGKNKVKDNRFKIDDTQSANTNETSIFKKEKMQRHTSNKATNVSMLDGCLEDANKDLTNQRKRIAELEKENKMLNKTMKKASHQK